MFRWKITGLLLLSLLCWELIVRLLVLSPAKEIFDPSLGYMHMPYANILRTYEGYARLSVDQFGLNNDALPQPLPDQRVLVLGDSYVEAYQVMREENFLSLLMADWPKILLFNSGVSDIAPDIALKIFYKFQPQVLPTHMLLCVNASDLNELLEAIVKRDADRNIIGLVRKQDGFTSFKAMKLWVYAHSALITHLKWKYENIIRDWFNDSKGNSHDVIHAKSSIDEAAARWHFVLNEFKRTRIPITVVLMPDIQYLEHGKAKAVVTPSRKVLIDVAKKLHISVLDSNTPMVKDFEATMLPAKGFANTMYGEGHLNAHGHQVLAAWLASQRDVILR